MYPPLYLLHKEDDERGQILFLLTLLSQVSH